MNLVEGQEITVEGSVIEDFSDFYTFEVYKKELPKEVTNEDLTKLEKMFNEAKKLEKEADKAYKNNVEDAEKKYQEIHNIYVDMGKIIKPYYLATWQPEPFEKYLENIGFSEKNIVIEENDNKQLKAIYEEWIKLEKDNQEEKANEKRKEFHKILQPYFDKLYPTPTFEVFIERFELDIPAEDLAKLKNIYDNAQKAEKEDNADDSVKSWEEFYYIIDQFIKPQTFEEYMADYDFKVSEADSKQLKQLYEEILKLNLKEDKVKIEEKWEAFHDILEPYFQANKEILISPSKLTVNGQDYHPQ